MGRSDKGPVHPERPGAIPPARGGPQPWGRWLSLIEDSCQAETSHPHRGSGNESPSPCVGHLRLCDASLHT